MLDRAKVNDTLVICILWSIYNMEAQEMEFQFLNIEVVLELKKFQEPADYSS